MAPKSKLTVLLASIPFITLIFAIPFVNRLEPMIWGMPFLLWWIVVNVLLTPLWLGLAHIHEKNLSGRAGARSDAKRGVGK
ncbi:hypothetical protein TcarDRAFT_1107 [Thermosinus carboxydivorans Nor1]|uniref:DUF3311 domain-containing protein n=1 Tax=Thermosinus carboxydivorans Nor1 TaxID=401526 RepID=A1HQW8_9FIRM|nr:DUF3311 domain-containing protein [Thermosinus carboxydivorans]EAX47685.1 hypothetical protein TcarDRAFT_1107 [Thermosinus carboxydivorans Nor1]